MTIIDSHAHFEPQLLDLSGLVARMNDHGIDATALIAAVTLDPIYKKPDYLMAIQRLMMQMPVLWTVAKIVDQGFHQQSGAWNPWYRKLISKKASYRISQNPDNASVFAAIDLHPDRFWGWVFVNPMQKKWHDEIERFADHPRAVGIKVHPFWHRYSVDKAHDVARQAKGRGLPLMIHSGFDELDKVKAFIKAFPDLTMVFAHAAFPFYHRLWPTLNTCENVFVDVSSHHVDARILKRCVAALGPEKVMFGTDDPYGESDYGLRMQRWINELKLSASEARAMLGQNFLKMTGGKY